MGTGFFVGPLWASQYIFIFHFSCDTLRPCDALYPKNIMSSIECSYNTFFCGVKSVNVVRCDLLRNLNFIL